jgi:hypothetical protein
MGINHWITTAVFVIIIVALFRCFERKRYRFHHNNPIAFTHSLAEYKLNYGGCLPVVLTIYIVTFPAYSDGDDRGNRHSLNSYTNAGA